MPAKITLMQGDLTQLKVDAIVNAANEELQAGGGVCGAIFRAGGSAIAADCNRIRLEKGRCPIGEAVITTGGNLVAKHVIHAVGPIWYGGNRGERELLAKTYHSALALANENYLKSVAFPNISTGIYGFPKMEAAQIAVETVKNFAASETTLDEIIFCCFDDENFALYQDILSK